MTTFTMKEEQQEEAAGEREGDGDGVLGEARVPGGAGRRPPPREIGRRPSTQGGREGAFLIQRFAALG